MLMSDINENELTTNKNIQTTMEPLIEEEEDDDMNIDSESIDKIEVENQSSIPKFNANSNSNITNLNSSSSAYSKFKSKKTTQKYVFQSKISSPTLGQNSFSNVKKTMQIHPLINNANGLTNNKNLNNLSLFQKRQNMLLHQSNKLESNKGLNNRKFLSNGPLLDSTIEEEEEEDEVPELKSQIKSDVIDTVGSSSPKKPISPSISHTKIGYGNNNSNINKLLNTHPNSNSFPYNIKLNHPNINAGPFPHTFKNYKNSYNNNKLNINFGSTSTLLNKLKANSMTKTQLSPISDSVNKSTQIKINNEEGNSVSVNKAHNFNSLNTIEESPIKVETIQEEPEDAMDQDISESQNNNTEEAVISEERTIETIKEESEPIEELQEKSNNVPINPNNTILFQNQKISQLQQQHLQQLQQQQLQQLQQQQLQQQQLNQQQLQQLQLQQQMQKLQLQQQQQQQHHQLIQLLQQQTQQRQLQQEQERQLQKRMEEQEKQIQEEQEKEEEKPILVPPVVPSTLNPLLAKNKQSFFDRSLNLNSIIILQTLGTGTFGRVHLVRSKENGKYYAMKAIKKSCVVKNHQVEHTMNEKRILENVCHPFFVKLQNTFQDSSHIFFITDYVCGGELFTCLRRYQRFPNNVAKFYAAEVIVAFDYLHSMDIIYRDLKPENILLDNTGHIKIIDFGFAKYVPDITYTLCGTPEYLAPEAIQMKAYGKSVDWYTLGILIYEMLCGFPPFYDDDRVKLYKKILAGKIYWPDHINPVVKNLLKHLITSDLTNRYGNLKGGSEDIKNHLWFAGVDWNKVARLEITPPFIPNVRYEGDAGHFESYPEVNNTYGEEGEDPYKHLFLDF